MVTDAAEKYTDDEGPETQRAPVVKLPRGFAVMDREKVREIAKKGAAAAHAAGTAHRWTSDAAREAGRKGGLAKHKSRGRGA